jgi:anti-sigma factor RsiW
VRCEEISGKLGAYCDGELPGGESEIVSCHLAGCTACAEEERALRRLGGAIASLRVPAPVHLTDAVHRAIARETSGVRPVDRVTATYAGPPRPLVAMRPWQAAAALAGAIAVSALATGLTVHRWHVAATAQSSIARDIATAHVRALVTDTTIQVASADPHTVKPWFSGRVEFAPAVRDLSADGFPLAGGRVDVVDGRRVGVAVYKRRLHTISIFMWGADAQAPGDGAPNGMTVRGYNMVTWVKAGVVYWAVSDLNAGELTELARLL